MHRKARSVRRNSSNVRVSRPTSARREERVSMATRPTRPRGYAPVQPSAPPPPRTAEASSAPVIPMATAPMVLLPSGQLLSPVPAQFPSQNAAEQPQYVAVYALSTGFAPSTGSTQPNTGPNSAEVIVTCAPPSYDEAIRSPPPLALSQPVFPLSSQTNMDVTFTTNSQFQPLVPTSSASQTAESTAALPHNVSVASPLSNPDPIVSSSSTVIYSQQTNDSVAPSAPPPDDDVSSTSSMSTTSDS